MREVVQMSWGEGENSNKDKRKALLLCHKCRYWVDNKCWLDLNPDMHCEEFKDKPKDQGHMPVNRSDEIHESYLSRRWHFEH